MAKLAKNIAHIGRITRSILSSNPRSSSYQEDYTPPEAKEYESIKLKDEATMTITLELPPTTEARLLAQAKAKGLTLDAFLQTIINSQAASSDSCRETPNGDEIDRLVDDIFDTVQMPAGVGEGAIRRENWYR